MDMMNSAIATLVLKMKEIVIIMMNVKQALCVILLMIAHPILVSIFMLIVVKKVLTKVVHMPLEFLMNTYSLNVLSSSDFHTLQFSK